MDRLPFVTPVYKRDLKIEKYFIGYLHHPYVSLYTGRGCTSRCTFCLWPQTVGGHSTAPEVVGNVIEEIAWASKAFPQVKEFFFDDDTFTTTAPRGGDRARARQAGRDLVMQCQGQCAVRDPEDHARQRSSPAAGRLEFGNQQILNNIKEGHAHRHGSRVHKELPELGIKIHGTFIIGLPGETRETIEETIQFRHGDQPTHYPGLDRRAISRHISFTVRLWKTTGSMRSTRELVDERGVQIAPLRTRTSATRRFSIRSRTSIGISISALPKSRRSLPRWSAVPRRCAGACARALSSFSS